jgi:shikimate kinase
VQGPIVLVGPMGAGKTTLGKRLAKELGLKFVDTDKVIARHHGPITRIFASKGEEYFRDLETKTLAENLDQPVVLSTGGGIVAREQNRAMLADKHVVFLDTAASYVLGKINLNKRPLLKDNPERWEEIYQARLPLYKEVAKQTIFTGGRSIASLLEELKGGIK